VSDIRRCGKSYLLSNLLKTYLPSILAFPLPPCIISIRINPVGWVMKKRKLFCEISPFTYEISLWRERIKRRIRDFKNLTRFAKEMRTGSLLSEELLKEIHTKVMHEIVEDMVKGEFAKLFVIHFSSCLLSRFSL
jgi:hypothetical protein